MTTKLLLLLLLLLLLIIIKTTTSQTSELVIRQTHTTTIKTVSHLTQYDQSDSLELVRVGGKLIRTEFLVFNRRSIYPLSFTLTVIDRLQRNRFQFVILMGLQPFIKPVAGQGIGQVTPPQSPCTQGSGEGIQILGVCKYISIYTQQCNLPCF